MRWEILRTWNKKKEERKTRKVAINDVLPLKAARCNAIANVKSFRVSRHQQLNFHSLINIRYAAPPYSGGIVLIASVYGWWAKIPVHCYGISHIVLPSLKH